MPPLLPHITANLHAVYADRPWLTAEGVVQSAVHRATTLRDLGASDVFAVGAALGSGLLPDDVPCAVLGDVTLGMMDSIRASERALDDVPDAVQARVDAWDPERRARAIRALYSSGKPVAGRRCWGARPASWLALEEKTTVDAVWDACGVPRAPSAVVDARLDALLQAHAALDAGDGTVWAADNRDGWHGGAAGLRWVRDADGARGAAAWVADHAHRVRVMPFLEGVPCSIHGIVFPDHVAALRPCEMVVLRREGEFRYAQAATFWDPPASDRAAMRRVARDVGAHLRERVGYRGVFTVDGVLGRDGFRPTELNPRFGAAVNLLAESLPSLHLYLLHLALIEGVDRDWRPRDLEAALVEAADASRCGSAMQILPDAVPEPRAARLVLAPGGWRQAEPDEDAHATATWGPSPAGGVLRLRLVPAHTPIGPAVAPRVVALMGFLDGLWEIGLGPLEAARSVQ